MISLDMADMPMTEGFCLVTIHLDSDMSYQTYVGTSCRQVLNLILTLPFIGYVSIHCMTSYMLVCKDRRFSIDEGNMLEVNRSQILTEIFGRGTALF